MSHGCRNTLPLTVTAFSLCVKVRGVLACSALKREYRNLLVSSSPPPGQGSKVECVFVVLNGKEEVVRERMRGRSQHFMPPGLLRSQYEALELPTPEEGHQVIVVENISLPVQDIVEEVLPQLSDTHFSCLTDSSCADLCNNGVHNS